MFICHSSVSRCHVFKAGILSISIIALYHFASGTVLGAGNLPQQASRQQPEIIRCQNTPRELKEKEPITINVSGARSDCYKITLRRAQFMRVSVRQEGMDVRVTIADAKLNPLLKLNAEENPIRTEYISWIAEAGSDYFLQVEVLTIQSSPSIYQVTLEQLTDTGPEDRALASLIKAELAFAEAQRLLNEGTHTSLTAAIQKYEESIPLWKEAGDKNMQARSYIAVGEVRLAMGDSEGMRGAIRDFTSARTLRQEISDIQGEAEALNNTGVSYDELGEKQEALQYHLKALPLRRAARDKAGESITLNNLGKTYADLSNRQEAVKYYNQALEIARESSISGVVVGLLNIGVNYYEMGELTTALDKYREAETLLNDRSRFPIQGRETMAMKAQLLNNIGLIYSKLGGADGKEKALDYYNQSLPIWRELRARTKEAEINHNIGRIYHAQGNVRAALDKYSEALRLIQGTGNRVVAPYSFFARGEAHDSLGQYDAAIEDFKSALSVSNDIGNRDVAAAAYYGMARAELNQQNFQAAQSHIGEAIQKIEALRLELNDLNLRASYFSTVQHLYDLEIDIYAEQAKHNVADREAFARRSFDSNESARARSFLELLAQTKSGLFKDVDKEVLAKETQLKEQILGYRQFLKGPVRTQTRQLLVDEARKKLEQAEEEYRNIWKILKQSPSYQSLAAPLKSAEIQQLLDRGTLLVVYRLGKDRSYVWVVSRDGPVRYVELSASRETIEKAAERAIRAAKALGESFLSDVERRQRAKDWGAASMELSRHILTPIASFLENHNLLFVLDSNLHFVPFAALPDPTQTRNTPLIANHQILMLPSASVLKALKEKQTGRPTSSKTIALIGYPALERKAGNRQDRLEGAASADAGRGVAPVADATVSSSCLSRLPRFPKSSQSITGEINGIKRVFRDPQSRFEALGASANKVSLAKEVQAFDIVHIAAHGWFDPGRPECSGVQLSPVDERGNPVEASGFLYLAETYSLKLSAGLVVLSACESGLGREVSGEGIMGVARGIMYSGASRTLSSLWIVHGNATRDLMVLFYQGVKDRKSPAAAFQDAQRTMWRRGHHPYFWAGFVMQGHY